jgi:PHS family inorganic phosphate transporter-like MFS transporter
VRAAITTFFFPALLLSICVKGILEMLAAVSVVGARLTLGLKESKKISLEEISKEELIEAPTKEELTPAKEELAASP